MEWCENVIYGTNILVKKFKKQMLTTQRDFSSRGIFFILVSKSHDFFKTCFWMMRECCLRKKNFSENLKKKKPY